MSLEVAILGPVTASDAGSPLRLGGPRQRALLAVLALNANAFVSEDRLLGDIWPNASRQAGKRNLKVYVSSLRKALGRGASCLETRNGGYALVLKPEQLDAATFEDRLARGRHALAAGDPAAAAEHLGTALALWRGPALGDLAFEPFAAAPVARLEELRLTTLETRIEAELALGLHAGLVGELEELVAREPLRERFRAQAMLALYRCGRQAEALAVFRDARRALRDELGLEPGPDLRALQQAILRHDPGLLVEPPELKERRHLPAPQTELVGRLDERHEVEELLRGGTRLVTLTGAGGSGKTRLALQVAHDLADAFPDGVYFVDLADLSSPRLVPIAIARALAITERDHAGLSERLGANLRRRRALLLLDNFEVVDEAAPLLADLLEAAPEVSLLVTSRTPLRLSGEHECRVQPLPLADATRLFAIRSRAVAPGFRRPSEEAAEVAEICRRLDCLPLAIELAAARTREYGVAEMLGRLSTLELATGGVRDLPERQRTLRATIAWSYELLSPDEQALFARLGVFAGGCTPEAAEAVCGADRAALASLVARSLLLERPGGADSQPRFAMLDTVRAFALERLETAGETSALRERHAASVVALAETARGHLTGSEQVRWLDRLDAERHNLRAALDFGLESGRPELTLKLAVDLERFWWVRAPAEGHEWLDRGLAAGEPPPALRAAALEALGAMSWFVGAHARALGLFEQALSLYRELADRAGEARALNRVGPPLMVANRYEEADRLVERALEVNRELGVQTEIVISLMILGTSAVEQGELDRAEALLEQSVELAREIGDHALLVGVTNLAEIALLRGDHGRADELARAALATSRTTGDDSWLLVNLSLVSVAAALAGEPRRAGILWGAVEALAEALGPSIFDHERHRYEEWLARAGEGFADGVIQGRSMSLDEVVETALAQPATPLEAAESRRP
jgi:predicted ATPase/DNA-binding SARP family transcriptional activator/Tfp pilus assembly protein PilF